MESNSVSAGYLVLFYVASILVSIAIGFWAGKVAQGKGYNFWIGFAAGFFAGIIGLIVIYVIKPATRRAGQAQYHQQLHHGPQPPAAPPRNKVCPACQNLIPGESQFCSYCGAGVSGTPTP